MISGWQRALRHLLLAGLADAAATEDGGRPTDDLKISFGKTQDNETRQAYSSNNGDGETDGWADDFAVARAVRAVSNQRKSRWHSIKATHF